MSLKSRKGPVSPLLLLALVIGLVGCGGSGEGDGESDEGDEEQEVTLNVFAAASLTDAFEELGDTFEEQNPGAEVSFNFAGSSTLAAQIRQAAPADVFASADEPQMEGVVEEGLVEEPQSFVQNRLAVIVPEENPADIQSYEDLAREDISFVLALEEVPVAEYTEESLQMANEVYGEGFEDEVLSNLVSREQDVRAAANRVALGEADATFVYTSDITPDVEDRVQVIEVPEEVNVVATYPIAVVEDSQNSELARAWVDLVLSGEGQGVLEEWGFQRAT